MNRQRWLSAAALLCVLLVSFFVHLQSDALPSVPESLQDIYRDEDGVPYLSEMDSYYYLRLAREMAETGSIRLYNHRLTDPLMAQRPVEYNGQGDPIFLSVLAFFIWRFLSLFGEVSIVEVARLMGPVFASLAAVPAFLYAKRRTNLAGAVTAGLLASLGLPFAAHTHAGFFDTDMLLAVVPLGFVLLQLRAMQEKKLWRQAVAGGCAGLLMGLLSLTWYGFHTYFWLLALGGLLGVLPVLLSLWHAPWRRKLQVVRGWLLSVLSAFLFICLIRGEPGLQQLLSVVNTFRNVSGSRNMFPFAHQYTGEMQGIPLLPDSGFLSWFRADLGNGLGCLGGLIPCLPALLAFPLSLASGLRKEKASGERHDALIAALTEAGILFLWLGFGVVLTRTGRRFAEIGALPISVLAGLGVGFLAERLKKLKVAWRIPARAALAVGVCVPLLSGSFSLARNARPDVTDSLGGAMAYVRETQPENAVLTGWWDDGYYMQYASRRRAITDGGTTSGAINYFLARALLSDRPEQSAGIFRMLENASYSGLNVFLDAGDTQGEGADKLLRLVSLSRAGAAEALSGTLPAGDIETLLDLTHPKEENPILLVLSTDLLSKLSAISYFGLWDVHTASPTGSVYWMAGSASRELAPGGEAVFSLTDSSILLTARMDEDGFVRVSQTQNGEAYHLSRLIVWRDGEKVQDTPLPGDGPVTILIEEEGRTALFSCSPNLADSLLVRLYVCGDQTLQGARLLGTWQGADAGDPCPAQRRIGSLGLSRRITQVWDLSGLLK